MAAFEQRNFSGELAGEGSFLRRLFSLLVWLSGGLLRAGGLSSLVFAPFLPCLELADPQIGVPCNILHLPLSPDAQGCKGPCLDTGG